ncbi:MAG TPA: lipocalin family protein, partial [Thermoanaerobaculia bacterium]|nr:lipocalin family protein [Thermoanaerobaculia bacterium]
DQVGWDWLALQLDDGRELMLYRLRRRDGSADPASRATLILADGANRAIPTSSLRLAETATWTSPASVARYPSRWHLEIPAERLSLDVRPLLADQELRLSFRYWEGTVEVAGRANGRPIAGHGYVEMTGYAR